ncbi:MAG: hypothetical protein PHU14_06705 [Methylovulum sp.]|nr:hypothetical protein [Methylovulum sp.]
MNKKTHRHLAVLVCLAASTLFVATAHAKADVIAAKQNAEAACAADATTANCGSEKIGSGLLKCIFAYKKANPSFHLSDTCKTALKALRTDVKANQH